MRKILVQTQLGYQPFESWGCCALDAPPPKSGHFNSMSNAATRTSFKTDDKIISKFSHFRASFAATPEELLVNINHLHVDKGVHS